MYLERGQVKDFVLMVVIKMTLLTHFSVLLPFFLPFGCHCVSNFGTQVVGGLSVWLMQTLCCAQVSHGPGLMHVTVAHFAVCVWVKRLQNSKLGPSGRGRSMSFFFFYKGERRLGVVSEWIDHCDCCVILVPRSKLKWVAEFQGGNVPTSERETFRVLILKKYCGLNSIKHFFHFDPALNASL